MKVEGRIIIAKRYSTDLIEAGRESRTRDEARERGTKGKRGLACRRETWRLEHEAIGRMGGEMLEGCGRR